MSYRDLPVPEMIRVSTPWVTEGDPAHGVLMKTPELSGLMPRLTQAHTSLFLVLPPESDGREEKLTEQAGEGDDDHDRKLRHLHASFDVVAETQSKEDAQKLLAIRDVLLPEGLRHTQRSYRGESGHAQRVATQVQPEQWERLGDAAVGKTTLRALAEDWIAAAQKLGEIEQQRARLREPEVEGPVHPSQVRNQWIRVVRVLVDSAKLAELDEESDFLLFNELRITLARSGKQGQQGEPDGSAEPKQQEELKGGAEPKQQEASAELEQQKETSASSASEPKPEKEAATPGSARAKAIES